MASATPTKEDLLNVIREEAKVLGRAPSKAEFEKSSGMSMYYVRRYFETWGNAVRSAGLEADSSRMPIAPDVLLEDWARIARIVKGAPTIAKYKFMGGRHDVGTMEKKLGPWSQIPQRFRAYAESRAEWADVLALIPSEISVKAMPKSAVPSANNAGERAEVAQRNPKLTGRPTYGNPLDFRGLRHEPVNENGVIFLFGMVARDLGYYVEAVQPGYPDCEAKRKIGSGKWQRVRIEFEYESRNFDHAPEGCDIIVCWRHNWPECPSSIQVVELSKVIKTLPSQV